MAGPSSPRLGESLQLRPQHALLVGAQRNPEPSRRLSELLREGAPDVETARADVLRLLREIFRYDPETFPDSAVDPVTELTVVADGFGYRAELPRLALVASGTKR